MLPCVVFAQDLLRQQRWGVYHQMLPIQPTAASEVNSGGRESLGVELERVDTVKVVPVVLREITSR
jgi:hypothetical protein